MILYVPDWACVICLVLALALTLIALHDFDSYLKHNSGDGMSNSTWFDFGDVLRDPKTRTRYVVGETKLYNARTGAVIALDEEKRSKLVNVGTIFNNLSKKLFNEILEPKPTGVKRYAFNSYSTLVGMIQGCRDDKLHINLCETASYSTKKNVAYKMLADYESSGDLHASLIAEYGKYACFGYRQVFVFSTLNGVHGFAEALRKHDGGVPVYEYTGASKPSVLGLGDDDVIVITTGMLSEYQTRRGMVDPSYNVIHWCNLLRSPLVQSVRKTPQMRVVLYASKSDSPFEIACLKHNIEEVAKAHREHKLETINSVGTV